MTWIEGLIATGIVVVLGLLIVVAYKEDEQWIAFSAAHDCKKVAHIKGEVFNTFGSDSKGNMTVGIGTTSSKTGWLCNDGVTYYR